MDEYSLQVAQLLYNTNSMDDNYELMYETQLLYFTHILTILRKKEEEEDSTLDNYVLFFSLV